MMQVMTFPRSTMNRVAITSVAIMLLAVGTLTLILTSESDVGQQPSAAASHPSTWVTQASESRTLEQNTELPTGESSDQILERSSSAAQYLEQNLWLPIGDASLSILAPEQRQNPTRDF